MCERGGGVLLALTQVNAALDYLLVSKIYVSNPGGRKRKFNIQKYGLGMRLGDPSHVLMMLSTT